MPAAIWSCSGKPSIRFAWKIGVPASLGNMKSVTFGGQRGFHLRNWVTTIGATAIARKPEADFGGPMTL